MLDFSKIENIYLRKIQNYVIANFAVTEYSKDRKV